jgi:hypothetical protein
MLREMEKHPPGPDRSQAGTDLPPTLEDLGVTKNASSRWQRVAEVPEPTRREYIEQTKASGGEVTQRAPT